MRNDREEQHALAELLQEIALDAYPNPQRLHCPGRSVLERIVSSATPSKHPVFDHVTHCSPCLTEVLEQKRIRQISTRKQRNRAAATIVSLIVVTVLGLQAWRNHEVRVALMASKEQLARSRQILPLEQKQAKADGSKRQSVTNEPILSVALWPGIFRGHQNSHPVELPAYPSTIIFLFEIEQRGATTYTLILKNGAGSELRRVSGLHDRRSHGRGRAVSIALPSELFTTGNYTASLVGKNTGGEEQMVEDYSFAVDKSQPLRNGLGGLP